MLSFLKKIAKLNSVREIVLLSHQGNVLFADRNDGQQNSHFALWKTITGALNQPKEMELLYKDGCCLVERVGVGYIITTFSTFSDDTAINKVKTACAGVRAQLTSAPLCRKLLLKLFPEVNPQFRPHIIQALLPFADKATGSFLLPLLGRILAIKPPRADALLLSLCEFLGSSGLQEALEPLQQCEKIFSENTNNTEGANDLSAKIVKAAKVAIRQLELDGQPIAPTEPPAEPKPVQSHASDTPQTAVSAQSPTPPVELSHPEEKRIQSMLENGQESEAHAQLVTLIKSCAHARDFQRAETLREWLIRIAPMSLTDIIQCAEIITEEKTSSIKSSHLTTWEDLAGFLSPEEFANLYHAMDFNQYKPDEMIAQQGECLSSLFFIHSGRVQLFVRANNRETPLKSCIAGEIIGAETFFDLSVWTVNARSLGAELGVLTWENLLSQKEQSPALRTKLIEYCERFPTANDLFAKTRRNRRQHDRKQTEGKVTLVVLDDIGGATDFQTRGSLIDVSRGGVAFLIRFSKKKNAIGLLNKHIKATIRPEGSLDAIERTGYIKAIRCQDFVGNDYSLHVEFDDILNSKELQQCMKHR